MLGVDLWTCALVDLTVEITTLGGIEQGGVMGKELEPGDMVHFKKDLEGASFGEEGLVVEVKEESFFVKGRVKVTTKKGKTLDVAPDDVLKKP